MTLEVTLTLDRGDLLYQEDVVARWSVTNRSDSPLSVPHPRRSGFSPTVRILNVLTGEETVHHKPRVRWAPDRTATIKGGESVSGTFPLSGVLPDCAPGSYDVTMLYAPAESAPVRLTIRPTLPKALQLDTIAPLAFYGAWVDLTAQPPRIVRTRFECRPGGGVVETRAIAPAHLHARPVLSLPPTGADRDNHWIAWTDGSTLRCVHVSEELGVSPVRELDLGTNHPVVFVPLQAEAVTDTRVRPNGAALLWADGRLRAFALGERIVAGNSRDLRGPQPVWTFSALRTALFIQESALFSLPWNPSTIGAPSRLCDWNGEFFAAGATRTLEDHVYGTVLLRKEQLLQALDFRLDPKGAFSAEPVRSLGWPTTEAAVEGKVAVSGQGRSVALLRDGAGAWWLVDGTERRALPPAVARTRLPLEAAFLGSEPVLLCGREGLGFQFLRMDGRPLPPRPF